MKICIDKKYILIFTNLLNFNYASVSTKKINLLHFDTYRDFYQLLTKVSVIIKASRTFSWNRGTFRRMFKDFSRLTLAGDVPWFLSIWRFRYSSYVNNWQSTKLVLVRGRDGGGRRTHYEITSPLISKQIQIRLNFANLGETFAHFMCVFIKIKKSSLHFTSYNGNVGRPCVAIDFESLDSRVYCTMKPVI